MIRPEANCKSADDDDLHGTANVVGFHKITGEKGIFRKVFKQTGDSVFFPHRCIFAARR